MGVSVRTGFAAFAAPEDDGKIYRRRKAFVIFEGLEE
jgi:hypothetical protein